MAKQYIAVLLLMLLGGTESSTNCQAMDGQTVYNEGQACGSGYIKSAEIPHIDNSYMWDASYLQNANQGSKLKGKTVILIGHGGFSKRFTLRIAKELGIKLVLFAPSYVSHFQKYIHRHLVYNFGDHTQDEQHAHEMMRILQEENITADGCVTFSDESACLAARLAELLGLTSSSSVGTTAAKMKSKTFSLLQIDKVGELNTTSYAVKSVLVEDEQHIEGVIEDLGLPVVIKLEYGAGSVGVQLAKTKDDCFRKYRELRDNLASSDIKSGMGLGFGQALTLMEYVSGSEHSVDVIIYNGLLLGTFIKDKGPTRKESFLETIAVMPTLLSKEDADRLIQAAIASCLKLGLRNGVFNVDLKLTESGPKLLEVNARMGGVYLWDWIKSLYGVDIVVYTYLISCGIKPIIPQVKPRGHVIGVMLLPSVHGDLINNDFFQREVEFLKDKGIINYNQFRTNTTLCGSGYLEKTFGNIAVIRENINTTISTFSLIVKWLRINSDEFPVDEYIARMMGAK